jgi:hypothetical protein
MKSNVFAVLAAVAVLAVFIGSVCLLGGYAAILFGSIIATFLASPEGQEGRTEDRKTAI